MQTPIYAQCQVVICKCGHAFAACVVPLCYEETDWMRDIRKYASQGCTIEIRDLNGFKLESCTCTDKHAKKESVLKNPQQLQLL